MSRDKKISVWVFCLRDNFDKAVIAAVSSGWQRLIDLQAQLMIGSILINNLLVGSNFLGNLLKSIFSNCQSTLSLLSPPFKIFSPNLALNPQSLTSCLRLTIYSKIFGSHYKVNLSYSEDISCWCCSVDGGYQGT